MIPPRSLPSPARALGAAVLVVGLLAPAPLLAAGASAAASASARAGAADGNADRDAFALTRRIAQRAGISVEAAEEVQASDSARVQADGSVVIVDGLEEVGHGSHGHEDPAVQDGATVPGQSAAAADRRAARRVGDVLALHSDPGASQTIFLDVDGVELVDSDWNRGFELLPPATYGGYSLDADPGFSQLERQVVVELWRETSAYFAAFDVDVTTEQPPRARLERSGTTDREFGTWVVVSTDDALKRGTCGECGGVAQLGVYGLPDGRQWMRPAFSFVAVASVVAHEVGHQLGLLHDGVRRSDGVVDEYYAGHGSWEPVMGGGGRPGAFSQWSRGDYAGATNNEDDYQLMLDHGLVLRTDTAGATPATAGVLGPDGSLQESMGIDDVDVVALPACANGLTVLAEVPDGGSLDVTLELLGADGAVVDTAASPVERSADGQALRFARVGQSEVLTDGAGRARFARVTPGSVAGALGYSSYGSTGGYRLATACGQVTPGAPTGVEVATAFREVTVSWQPPVSGLVTGYRVSLGDRSQVVPAGVRSFAVLGAVFDTSAVVGVEALFGTVAGPEVTRTVQFPPMPTMTQAAPVVDVADGTVRVSWSGTVSPEIVDARWRVYVAETLEEVELPLTASSHELGVLPGDGDVEVEVCLRIPLRESSSYVVCDVKTARYAAGAEAPGSLQARVVDFFGTVELTWTPVAGATGYEVSVDRGPWTSVAGSSSTLVRGLADGRRELRLRAVTGSGPGGVAVARPRVIRAPSPPRDLVGVPSADGTSIDLTWRRPSDDEGLLRYVLRVPQQDREVLLTPDATSYTLTGLEPGSLVTVLLSGGSAVVSGELASVDLRMPGGSGGPGGPGALPVPVLDAVKPGKRGGKATVVVRWSASVPDPSVLSGWELRLTPVGSSSAKMLVLPPDFRTWEVRLSAKQKWQAIVRAVGFGELGAPSGVSRAVRPR